MNKKLNKKGFTLVELLAIIILLAVVAVAAVTAILNTINKNKRKTFVATYNEIRNQTVQELVTDGGGNIGSFNAAHFGVNDNDYDIAVTGDATSGYVVTVTMDNNGQFGGLTLDDDACASAVEADECSGKNYVKSNAIDVN